MLKDYDRTELDYKGRNLDYKSGGFTDYKEQERSERYKRPKPWLLRVLLTLFRFGTYHFIRKLVIFALVLYVLDYINEQQ